MLLHSRCGSGSNGEISRAPRAPVAIRRRVVAFPTIYSELPMKLDRETDWIESSLKNVFESEVTLGGFLFWQIFKYDEEVEEYF